VTFVLREYLKRTAALRKDKKNHLLVMQNLMDRCREIPFFALDHPATFKTLSTETNLALALDTAADRTL
jgi:hypothetical protein